MVLAALMALDYMVEAVRLEDVMAGHIEEWWFDIVVLADRDHGLP